MTPVSPVPLCILWSLPLCDAVSPKLSSIPTGGSPVVRARTPTTGTLAASPRCLVPPSTVANAPCFLPASTRSVATMA